MSEDNTKVCINCKETKVLDKYQTRKRGNKIEYLGRCKICENQRVREWKQKKAIKIKKEKIGRIRNN